MRIREFERVLREAMRTYPGQSPLALLATDGPLATKAPQEFVDSATTLASRSGKSREDTLLSAKAKAAPWV